MTDEIASIDAQKTPITVAEFLEGSPPNTECDISDLFREKIVSSAYRECLNTPELQLHCTTDSCNGVRFFRCISGNLNPLPSKAIQQIFLTYRCSNCQKSEKSYALRVIRHDQNQVNLMYKFGEDPPYGPPTPPKLIKLFGSDRENFLKGRRCENQGLGVGAFAYYRRVVEHQKNRIFREIIKVSEKLEAPAEKIALLQSALQEDQFTKALSTAKDALPESLLINGHSPLKLLYRALSDGIHNLSDEECLTYAASIRMVLGELSERLSQALKDEAELTQAINRLLAPRKQEAVAPVPKVP